MTNTSKTIIDLIPKYIEIVNNEEENSEVYKWDAVQQFQENWDIDAPDFHTMFSEAFKKRENLIYQNSFGFLNKLSQHFPEELRSLFRNLYDDTKSLAKRILEHQKKSSALLEQLKSKIDKTNYSHQQDERTVSFLLVLRFPEDHFLYKNNVYEAFCKHIGLKIKKAGEKLFHFEELCKDVKNEVSLNKDLLNLESYIQVKKNYSFEHLNLIIQDIIYRVLIVDVYKERRIELLTNIFNDIQNIISDKNHPLQYHFWAESDAENFRQLSIFPNRNTNIIHYELMMYKEIAWELHPEGHNEFKVFIEPFIKDYDNEVYKCTTWKIGYAGQIKSGTFNKIVPRKKIKIIEKEGHEYNQMIVNLTNQLIDLYNDTDVRLKKYLKTDIHFSNEFGLNVNNMKNHSLNQILYGPPGTGKTYSTIDRVVQICSPNQYEKNNHKSNKVIYDQLVEDGNVFFTTFHQSFGYEDFIEGIKPVLSTQGNDAISYAVEDGIFKSISEQCLDEIREIKTQWDENIQDVMSFKEKYDEFVKRIQKGLIVVKTRNELEANVTRVSASGNMRLKTGKDTNDYIISSGRLKKLVEELPNPKSIKNIHDKVRSIIGGSHTTLYYAALEAFVEFEKELNNEIKEVGKEVKLKNITLSDFEINELPKYVLVIDEINRGNVSAIFGELITLLEEDKRFGRENQLFAKLPYSKLDFTVPPNLYIIGTMNTADRSVEALDTALRRRFSFHEMMPNPELLVDKGHKETGEVEGINLKQLLRTINERIEVLVDRDHTIGHSYFLKVQSEKDLKNVFKDKVIPLLQEYFFGDYSKMEMVIGSYFFKKELPQVTFAVTSENYYEERKRYVFKDFDSSEFDIITALKELLGIKEQVAVES